MKNTLEYKGFARPLEFTDEDSLLFGKVLGIRSLISYGQARKHAWYN